MSQIGFRHLYAVLTLLLLLTACQSRSQEIFQQQILQFGTIIDATIVSSDPALAEKAMRMLEDDFATMQASWQVWKPGPLMALNQALSNGRGIIPEPSLVPLIRKATSISRSSNYLFNPAVGKLIALWGFHKDEFGRNKSPSAADIRALVNANPRMDDLYFRQHKLYSRNPAVKLDFGGFAKGYGLGLEAHKLKSMGIDNFILNAGGDLVAWGHHPMRSWKIGVRDASGSGAIATVEPGNGDSIFTSGDYERRYMLNGKQRHHIIDPRTGYPSQGAHAVTVIHQDPALADAVATALMVAAPSEWATIAVRLGVDKVLLIDHEGQLHISPAMLKKIQLAPGHTRYTLLKIPGKRDPATKTPSNSNLSSQIVVKSPTR